MCGHEEQTRVPAGLSRRNVLAGAAVLAGVGTLGLAGAPGALAADRDQDRSENNPQGGSFGRPPVPPALIVSGGPLLDPATGHVDENGVVVLDGGRVLAAGDDRATARARGKVAGRARTIDVGGAWILPGLVDAHVHVNALADAAGVLHAGATTARSGSSNFYQDVALRTYADWNPGHAPRMRAAGVFVTPDLGDTVLADPALVPLAGLPNGVRDPRDLQYVTRVNLSRGVDHIKTRANPRAGLPEQDPLELVYNQDQISAIVGTAKQAGKGVMCHAYSADGIAGAVKAGIRSLEHGVFVTEETLTLMAQRGVYFTPTLAAISGDIGNPDPVLDERGRTFTPVLQAAIRAAHDKGVPVVAGTDSFGTFIDPVGKEAALIADAGLPKLDAIRAATTVAARLLGWADRAGRLLPGYNADVVAVDGSPLDDVHALERVRLVIAQGAIARQEAGIT